MTLPGTGPVDLTVSPELRGRVRLGIAVVDGLTVRDTDAAVVAEGQAVAASLRAAHGGAKSGEVPGTLDARTLYKALGMDPTKTRPSNEALLRRVLKGEALYTVNTLVDTLNLCSLRHQLPFGLYDFDLVRPPVVLRRGTVGEAYEGIRKGQVSVDGRPVLADAEGPFGNPSSDSARTMITTATARALVVAYAPVSYAEGRVAQIARDTARELVRFCGGGIASVTVVS